MMQAFEIHARLGANGWREVLLSAGVDEKFLRDRHGPCPVCGGSDRFRFDNRHGRGDYFCNQCRAGDGFKLLMGFLGQSFADVRKLVLRLAGIEESDTPRPAPRPAPIAPDEPARPTGRVVRLLRESCMVEDCEPARLYLASRALWPLPQGHGLRAHPSVTYWQKNGETVQEIGLFPALIVPLRNVNGELVTMHVTYLTRDGSKISTHDPRKILSKTQGHEGCAARLMPHGETLGIAEGIETALSASVLHSVPVWAALNATLLQKFQPPADVRKLVIFADRDVAGLDAALKLAQRLQGQVQFEIKTPHEEDWNETLCGRSVA